MRKSARSRVLAGLAAIIAVSISALLPAQEISRQEAESRLEALKAEIADLQQSLAESREQFTDEQAALRTTDLEIQAAALKLRELAEQRSALDKELAQLEAERSDYLDSLGESKALLGRQIVSAYQLGRESRLKLLLNQDSPARLSRMLAYYEYFSHAQVEQIQDLRVALETLDGMQAEIDTRLLALNELQREREQEQQAMQQQREKRQSVLDSLAGRISSSEARLTELRRNRSDLEALLERLSSALADIPTDLGQYSSALEQRGSIPPPVQGRVMKAFGQSRMGGLAWHGWLIEADPGSEVRVIAYGRVAYADWLRGYGLLMIVDHGDGIMSLYGNNESLLYDVGDWVQQGSLISTVGRNADGDQGLYFELRNKGKAVDPASWINR